MLIIIDGKTPQEAKKKLAEYGRLVELQTSGITYEAISGHPDIFFHQADGQWIIAPNLPSEYFGILDEHGLHYILGEQDIGEKYPATSAYNAVSAGKFLIHNFRNTDAMITRTLEDADLIHVDQGYTRCNLLALGDKHFITSDRGIERVLKRFDKDCLYVDPAGILLPGVRNGFFGGCCGIRDNTVFIIGSLSHYTDGKIAREYIMAAGYRIVELYDGPLFDGGGIFFIN